jgi:hypothetical protein
MTDAYLATHTGRAAPVLGIGIDLLSAGLSARVLRRAGARTDVEDVGPDSPYDPVIVRAELEARYGAGNVKSTTVPSSLSRNVGDPGTRAASGVVYDVRGLPIFDDVALAEVRLPRSAIAIQSRGTHFRAATRELRDLIESGSVRRSLFTPEQLRAIRAGSPKIPEMTWHHHQDVGRMQLVPTEIHQTVETPHLGGFALWYGN